MVNEEFVSRIKNNLKAISKDGHVSSRFILRIGQTKTRFLLAQKIDEYNLFNESAIISTIECFEMEGVPPLRCGIIEFKSCQSVMVSTKELPETIFGKSGSGVLSVSSIDGTTTEFHPITPSNFANQLKRHYKRAKTKYYSIIDNKLYLLNSEVEAVRVRIIALNPADVIKASSCCSKESFCESYWKLPFICPDRFIEIVSTDTLKEVASIYRTSVEDTNPNLDENLKGKTQ